MHSPGDKNSLTLSGVPPDCHVTCPCPDGHPFVLSVRSLSWAPQE